MKEKNNFWIDDSSNKWNADFFSQEKAIELSSTMINCRDCEDCESCTDCVDCWDSNDCTNCKECWRCTDCIDCINCERCWRCSFCEDCRGCEGRHIGFNNNDDGRRFYRRAEV